MKRIERPTSALVSTRSGPLFQRSFCALPLLSPISTRALFSPSRNLPPILAASSSAPSFTLLCGVRRGTVSGRRSLTLTRINQAKRDNIIDAEPVQSSSASPPRTELPQQQIDEQFDRVYEKLFHKKRPTRGDRDAHDAANPFTQDWRERLFDIMFSNAGSFLMMTVVISLFFQITREHGEHKEYKRLTTARLEDAQRALRLHQTQVHQAVNATREELDRALEPTSGKAVAPEEVKRLVDQLLAGLVANIDASLAAGGVGGDDTTISAAVETSRTVDAGGDLVLATAPASAADGKGGYHKVV